MEIESWSKEQMLDAMHKIIEDQKVAVQAALEEHRQATAASLQEQQRSTLEMLNEIRADLSEIQLRLERGTAPPTTAPSAPASSPPLTPRAPECCPHGRGDDKFHRGKATETSGLYVPPPVRGAQANCSIPSVIPDESHGHFQSIPKIDFPKFDGVCPKLWQHRCEDYFALYGTHRSLWITIATMQFEGATARWLQSVQRKIPTTTWEEFCSHCYANYITFIRKLQLSTM
jgi:hypothetical protein